MLSTPNQVGEVKAMENKHLKDLKKILVQIPHFSIDHLGLSQHGIKELFYWAEKGIKIKATGFGRLDFNPIQVMKTIYAINPESLMFGTDLPSTRAREPFNIKHLEMIKDNFSESELLKILYQNAINHYNKK